VVALVAAAPSAAACVAARAAGSATELGAIGISVEQAANITSGGRANAKRFIVSSRDRYMVRAREEHCAKAAKRERDKIRQDADVT
jgi:hypothetical protein